MVVVPRTLGSRSFRARRQRGAPCGLRPWLLCLVAWGLLALPACEETASSVKNEGILLVQPLNLDWPGKDAGAPFQYEGVFSAQANLRVKWKFRLDVKPADPDDPRFPGGGSKTVYKTEFTSQDRIGFTWNTSMSNVEAVAFAPGDTCTARLEILPELAPGEEEKAFFRFAVGF